MFNNYQEACNAISNNCTSKATFTYKSNNLSVGTNLYSDLNATVLAGSGFIIKNGLIYTVLNGTITSITNNCVSGPPIGNLTEIKNIFIGYPNLYTSNDDVYDKILNKFSNASNEITSVYSTNGFNLGSNVYKTNVGVPFGTGYLAYFVGETLKKVKVLNGIIVESESNVTVSSVLNPSTTKILSPFKNYDNSGNYIGTGYSLYDNNSNFLYFASKLEIASDGLTITDTEWGNPPNGTKYWLFNKEKVSNDPLINFKIPEIYKGSVVEIQIVKIDSSNPGANNSFSYTLLIAK